MNDAVYRIVEHDGGWAYQLDGVFSETFASRRAAEAAAERVAREQRMPGEDAAVSWEDANGVWHDEVVHGEDRPNAFVAGAEAPSAGASDRNHRSPPESAAASMGDYAMSAYDRGDQYARYGGRMAREQIRSNPLIALSAAMASGFILALFLHRRA